MLVKLLSRKNTDGTPRQVRGEFVGFQFIMMPGGVGLDPRTQQLIQGPPQPVAMVMVACKDQFVIGPVSDMVPVWEEGEDDLLDDFGDDVPDEGETITEEELAQLLNAAAEEDGTRPEPGELPVEELTD